MESEQGKRGDGSDQHPLLVRRVAVGEGNRVGYAQNAAKKEIHTEDELWPFHLFTVQHGCLQ